MSISIEDFRRAKDRLEITMRDLRSSIAEATEKMSEMYGETHHSVTRLRSYFPALDLGEKYVAELDVVIQSEDFEGINFISQKIRAISEMIKDDARDLLVALQHGKETLPDDTILH